VADVILSRRFAALSNYRAQCIAKNVCALGQVGRPFPNPDTSWPLTPRSLRERVRLRTTPRTELGVLLYDDHFYQMIVAGRRTFGHHHEPTPLPAAMVRRGIGRLLCRA
jgi:hypothetical protein